MGEIKPEAKAREIIDRKLNDAGWDVINRDEYCEGMQAVAVREALLRGNKEADYLLFIEGKAIGVVEAKREETDLGEVVVVQAEDYTRRVPEWCQAWFNPLPIVYLANGREIKFRNCQKSDSEYETISEFHSPYALLRMFALRGVGALYYGGLPTLRRHYGTKSIARTSAYRPSANSQTSNSRKMEAISTRNLR